LQFLGITANMNTHHERVYSSHTHCHGDALITEHCTSSSQVLYDDEWENSRTGIDADSIIHHIVNGDTVLTYSGPQ
jgi:hypothetical protein